MLFRYLTSEQFLLRSEMLWSLFWVNLAGTVYGYIWYGNQLRFTAEHYPAWNLPFVPDSPTASLFFTVSLLLLLLKRRQEENPDSGLPVFGHARGIVDAFGAVTSVKYGIWAVAMIMAAAAQGDALAWQDWMLTVSHLGMAAEAYLFVKVLRIRWTHIAWVTVWMLLNDFLDYNAYQVFPWLPEQLEDDLAGVELFTFGLSLFSAVSVAALYQYLSTGRMRRV